MELPPSFDGAPAVPVDRLPAAVRDELARRAAGPEPVAAYLYDTAAAVARAERLTAALPAWVDVYYAVKANPYGPLVEALAGTVTGFEVASCSEVALADDACAKASVPTWVTASGPGKQDSLLHDLARLDGAIVNAESELELHRLSRAAVAAGRVVPVALRVNPDRTDMAGSLRMGGVASPFGIPEERLDAAIALAARLPGLDPVGFHVHAVSGNLDADAHAAYVRQCLGLAVERSAAHGIALRTVDAGGGIGVPFEDEAPFDLDRFGALLREIEPPPGVRVALEPGRWLAAPVGWYAAQVTDVKESRGAWFAVVRGGINHFQLPTSWDIRHNFAVLPVDAWPDGLPRPEARDAPVTVVGELCTPEDVLARDVTVGALRAGDVVVFPNAGAYGFEFAMPAFLGHPPAERITLPIA
ncbi:MAG: hypothetical protein GEV10_10645 [Streptosporangiales bacterium]|nr:hypothetical protein [Streptosporangiales bacterium]